MKGGIEILITYRTLIAKNSHTIGKKLISPTDIAAEMNKHLAGIKRIVEGFLCAWQLEI